MKHTAKLFAGGLFALFLVFSPVIVPTVALLVIVWLANSHLYLEAAIVFLAISMIVSAIIVKRKSR